MGLVSRKLVSEPKQPALNLVELSGASQPWVPALEVFAFCDFHFPY